MTDIIDLIVNAIMTGFGVAVGSYLANNHFLKKLEKVMEKITKQRMKNNV
jgi:hypothetical protein